MTATDIIAHFTLAPHPEGGFYRRTYTAPLPTDFRGTSRPVCTAILFLLSARQYSRLHRIPQDEMWHFYLGGPLRLAMILPDGTTEEVLLGQDILSNQRLQYTVPAGSWFGATPASESAFSLVGCTVAPGFSMDELELGETSDLLARFPWARNLIEEFCPPNK